MWWQPFAAVRPAAGGGTLFVVHLINPPEGKTVLAKENVPSGPAKDVAVTFQEPKGFRRAALVNFTNSRIRSFRASSWTGSRCSRRTWWCWRTSRLAGWASGKCG